MEPIAPPPSARIGISISPSGKIGPALFDDPQSRPDAILITLEEFEALVQRLKGEILKVMVVPRSEDEIPKLIRALASKHV